MPDRDQKIAHCTPVNHLLTSYMEKDKLVRRPTTLDSPVGMTVAIVSLGRAEDENFSLQLTGGRYFLTGRDSSDETGHNDFEILEVRSPGFFALDSGPDGICLFVCRATHIYV